MTIEPGIADLVVGPDVVTDWDAYQKCSVVCGAPTGEACFAMYARVVDGQTEGEPKRLTIAHGSRRRRRGR